MKNALLVIFALTTIGLGTVCFLQARKVSEQKSAINTLRADAEQQTREIADLQASKKLVEQQRRELLDQASDLALKLLARQQTDATISEAKPANAAPASESAKPEKDKNPFGNFLAKLMEDPETKKMIRQQQRMVLDQLYAPLIKQLNLTPADAEQFKDLLADNLMKGAEKATSLMGADSATNRTEMLAKLAEEQKSFNEQVRGFLGETGYAQYLDYQQTVGERTQLNQFQQQYAGAANALTDQQTEQLLQFMSEEKKNLAATTSEPLPGSSQDAATIEAMLSENATEKLLQRQETINQRVYERAKDVLSEDQLASFARFQTNQLQMMRMGMNMARKFMTPDQSGPTAPQTSP